VTCNAVERHGVGLSSATDGTKWRAVKGIGGAHEHVVGEVRWRRAEALDRPHQDLRVPLVQREAVAPRVEHALRAVMHIAVRATDMQTQQRCSMKADRQEFGAEKLGLQLKSEAAACAMLAHDQCTVHVFSFWLMLRYDMQFCQRDVGRTCKYCRTCCASCSAAGLPGASAPNRRRSSNWRRVSCMGNHPKLSISFASSRDYVRLTACLGK